MESEQLSNMLSNVSLGDLIEECVINVKDGKAIVYAIDMTNSVCVQASTEIDMEDTQLGIGDLSLFVKYLSALHGAPVKASIKDNRLLFEAKKGNKVMYLLTEPDLISTFEEILLEKGDIVSEELESYDYGTPITLQKENVEELLKITNLFTPNSIVFEVTSKGKLLAQSGNDTEHKTVINMGKIKTGACSIKLYRKHLTSILSNLDWNGTPMLYLSADTDSSVVITSTGAGWILQPMNSVDD